MTEYEQVEKFVLENKPENVKIKYLEDLENYINKYANCINNNSPAYFLVFGGVQEICIKKDITPAQKSYYLLHEFCHSLTWRDEFNNSGKLQYLAEYVAEKKLRKISRENNFIEMLKFSDTWVDYHFNCEVKKYSYAAKRIKREELI